MEPSYERSCLEVILNLDHPVGFPRFSAPDFLATSAGQCAGINRHMVGDERALQERNSETILASSFALTIVRW